MIQFKVGDFIYLNEDFEIAYQTNKTGPYEIVELKYYHDILTWYILESSPNITIFVGDVDNKKSLRIMNLDKLGIK